MDCSLPGSSVHGNFQASVLEWVAISFSRGSSQPRDQSQVSCSGAQLTDGLSCSFYIHLTPTVYVLWGTSACLVFSRKWLQNTLEYFWNLTSVSAFIHSVLCLRFLHVTAGSRILPIFILFYYVDVYQFVSFSFWWKFVLLLPSYFKHKCLNHRKKVKVTLLSHVRLFETLWTVAYEVPP